MASKTIKKFPSLLLLASILACATSSYAQIPLDPQWNSVGYTQECRDEAMTILQPHFMAGKVWWMLDYDGDSMALECRHTTGAFQTSWGTAGRVVRSNSMSIISLDINQAGQAFALVRDNFVARLQRLLTDGSPDPSWQPESLPIGCQMSTITIDHQGRILASGLHLDTNDDQDCMLARYLPDGTLDQSFGVGGVVQLSTMSKGDKGEYWTRVFELANGNLVALGEQWTDDNWSFTSYSLISVLDAQGQVINPEVLSNPLPYVSDVAPRPNGGFLICGGHHVMAFDALGVADAGFGAGAALSLGDYDLQLAGIEVQNDGRIALGGKRQDSIWYWPVVLVLDANGVPDPGFGLQGEASLWDIFPMGTLTTIDLADNGAIMVSGFYFDGFPSPSSQRCAYIAMLQSDLALAQAAPTDIAHMQLYPSPNNGEGIWLTIPADAPRVEYAIFDVLGRQFGQTQTMVPGADNRIWIEAPGTPRLSPGTYFVRVKAGKHEKTLPWVVR